MNWYLNTAFPSPLTSGDGVAELQTALQAWTAPTSASIILQFAGTTNQGSAKGPWSGIGNGNGVVTFEDPNGEISGSTLAIGGGFATSGGGTVNGMVFGKFTRGYVIWANSADLSSSFHQSLNFSRVMEHEIGHTIGMGHSDQGTSNIMYASCCSGTPPVPPALGPDDLAGLNFIYPSGSAPPPPPPPATCTYSITPSVGANIAAIGGLGSVAVTAPDGCTWTASVASGSTSMLSITSGSSGSGNGTVTYSVTANDTTAARTGAMTIAGQGFVVGQSGATCTYALSASAATSGIAGGASSLTVSTNISTCTWTAASNDGFVTVTSGASSTGSGTVGYSVTANAGVSYRTGTLTIAGQTFTVTQSGSGPTMSLDKPLLNYGGVSTGLAFTSQTLGQTVRLSQSGAGIVTWTATPTVSWLTVSPTSGSGPATFTVRIAHNSSVPGAGTIAAAVTLAFTGAGTGSGPISVSLKIFPQGSSAVSVGAVDTPAEGVTGVTGSIAVTGWTLDDIEVRQVRILRDPVAGEGTGLIPIGSAVFVDGSRPDVAGLFPTTPRNTRGGWGYLMLTNFLPGQGNGTFRIHAYADDADGHNTLLGSRTITVSNSTAIKPLGAIDTPGQGEVVSGTHINFGWVLALGPALAYPPNGTVSVLIDGVVVGSPGGWASRPDLTSLFPAATYPGITNALGVFGFDTTTMTNGLHTIAWVVTSSNGQTDGIGSRYFTVANGSGPVLAAPVVESHTLALPESFTSAAALLDEVSAATLDTAPVMSRRGYDLEAPFRRYGAGASGRSTVYGEELDRFEIRLGEGGDNAALTGYMRTGEGLAPLPIGSHLEAAAGVFTWQPGVGFVHGYDLVFVRWSGGRAASRREIRIVITPKGSNRVGPQIMIDAPSSQADVGSPFVLGGWAIDSDADTGTGVTGLHVWAYPSEGGAPLFVGVAAYGGRRPDVAAVLGDRFRDSGYGLIVGSLPPGTYDLAVFAWSTVSNGFVPAKVVRVMVR